MFVFAIAELVYYYNNTHDNSKPNPMDQSSEGRMAPFRFAVNAGSAEPIYKQLIAQVQRAIAAGTLREGDELPSVRAIAEQLAVNPMTVSKAYSQLEMSGALMRQRGVGMEVASGNKKGQSMSQRLALLKPTLRLAANEAQQLEITDALALKQFAEILKGKKS